MTTRARAAVVALIIGTFVLTGCGGVAPTSDDRPAGTGGVTAPSAVPSAPTTVPPGAPEGLSVSPRSASPRTSKAAAGPSSTELAAIKRQLDAMQKEIDALDLPSDNDFSGAESAVY